MASLVSRARYAVVLPVLGTFVASVALHMFGLLRAAGLAANAISAAWPGGRPAFDTKDVIVESVVLIDLFLVATAFLVIAAGLYELFLGELPLPAWLQFHDFDDLKARLAAVIVVGLLVAFLGEALRWRSGSEILALGAAVAIVMLSSRWVFGLPGRKADPLT